MIRDCTEADFIEIGAVVNDGARAYRGVISEGLWHEPYMSDSEIHREIAAGVAFRGWFDDDGGLVGVMGAQPVQDVLLIRHAYVRTARRRGGIGSGLIRDLQENADRRLLVGTWAAATWAVSFYEKHGFRVVGEQEKDSLLRRYWTVPESQISASVVLVGG
jgi:GNAT superfamily N-acetyltransferase